MILRGIGGIRVVGKETETPNHLDLGFSATASTKADYNLVAFWSDKLD